MAEVFSATAGQVFLPAVLPADELAAGNARLQGGASAAQVAGPGLAGLLATSAARSPRCSRTRPASWSPPPRCCGSGPGSGARPTRDARRRPRAGVVGLRTTMWVGTAAVLAAALLLLLGPLTRRDLPEPV